MSQRPNRARRTNTGSNRPDRSRSGRAGSGRAGSGRSRSSRPPVKGKRGSVKAVAQRQVNRRGAVNSRNLKRVKTPHRAPRIVFVVALCVIIIGAGAAAVLSQTDTAKYATCEQYRPVVQQACKDCGLDTDWTDCLLAAMVVESGGDKNVRSVLNVEGDIMQAAEGAYGWIVMNGWPERGIAAESTEASIYAGVMEFKQNLQLWEGYLGTITPNDATEIQLVIQGTTLAPTAGSPGASSATSMRTRSNSPASTPRRRCPRTPRERPRTPRSGSPRTTPSTAAIAPNQPTHAPRGLPLTR